jgi:hypothetical protein
VNIFYDLLCLVSESRRQSIRDKADDSLISDTQTGQSPRDGRRKSPLTTQCNARKWGERGGSQTTWPFVFIVLLLILGPDCCSNLLDSTLNKPTMGATDVPQAQAVTVSLQELVNGELIQSLNGQPAEKAAVSA